MHLEKPYIVYISRLKEHMVGIFLRKIYYKNRNLRKIGI
jgi:hypothetical protein